MRQSEAELQAVATGLDVVIDAAKALLPDIGPADRALRQALSLLLAASDDLERARAAYAATARRDDTESCGCDRQRDREGRSGVASLDDR